MARLREVFRVQVLHTDERFIATHHQGEAPLGGREGRPLRPPPPQRGRREPVRRPGREGLLVPGLEEGHGQVGNLDATTDELDELGEIVVAQNPELQRAAGDPQRERGKNFLQGEHAGLFPMTSAREQRLFQCRRSIVGARRTRAGWCPRPVMPRSARTADVRACRHGAMSVMEDREPPPPYFGDYPHGAYWSAVRPEGGWVEEAEDNTVEGSQLRIMWDEGAGPLWATEGLLPDDPEWLRRALDLSDSLVADLLTWLSDMTALHLGSPVADWRERARALERRGRELADRVQAQVGARYRVRYHA